MLIGKFPRNVPLVGLLLEEAFCSQIESWAPSNPSEHTRKLHSLRRQTGNSLLFCVLHMLICYVIWIDSSRQLLLKEKKNLAPFQYRKLVWIMSTAKSFSRLIPRDWSLALMENWCRSTEALSVFLPCDHTWDASNSRRLEIDIWKISGRANTFFLSCKWKLSWEVDWVNLVFFVFSATCRQVWISLITGKFSFGALNSSGGIGLNWWEC